MHVPQHVITTAASPPRTDGRRFLNIWMAGLAFVRCFEHGEDVDNAARDTLAAMASFVGRDDRHKLNPVCVAAQGAIAERAKLSVRAVADAQKRLADAGLVERLGQNGRGLSFTVKWRLTLLSSSAGAAEEQAPSSSARAAEERPTDDRGSAGAAEERPAGAAEERPAGAADNISSDLSRPPGREKRGRSDAATRLASADAAAAAATPSTEQGASGVVAEVMAARGGSQRDAEAWIARKLGQASAPVKNETAYLRRCLEQEAAPAPAPGAKASAKKTAKKGKSAPARTAKPYWRVRNHQVAEAVAASRGGESHVQLAERLNVTTLAVDQCREMNDRVDGFNAALAGEAPEEVAARFPHGHSAAQLPVVVQRYRDSERRRRAIAALRRGESPQEVAEQSGTDVDTVRSWRREADELAERKRRAGIAA